MIERYRYLIIAATVLLLSTLAGIMAGGALMGTGDGDQSGKPKIEALAQEAPATVASDADLDSVAMLQQASDAAMAHTGGHQVTEIELLETDGSFEVEVLLDDGREVKLFLNEDFEVVAQGREGVNGRTVSGETLEAAVAAALRHTGGGRVVGIELSDEQAAYEVDIILPNGKAVEVYLDDEFAVQGQR